MQFAIQMQDILCLACQGQIIKKKIDSRRSITPRLKPTMWTAYIIFWMASFHLASAYRWGHSSYRSVLSRPQPTPSRLKPRKSFLHAVRPCMHCYSHLNQPSYQKQYPKQSCQVQPMKSKHVANMNGRMVDESQFRTDSARVWVTAKRTWVNGGYADAADIPCECRTFQQSMQHLLRCMPTLWRSMQHGRSGRC